MNAKPFALLEWRSSPLTMAEFLDRMRQYVARLAEVSDVFGALRIVRAPKSHPLIRPEDDDFIDRFIPFLFDRDTPYDGLDKRGRPTRDTTAWWGLNASLQTPGPWREGIWWSLNDGPTAVDGDGSSQGGLMVHFPATGDLARSDLAETVFRASVEFWAPAWGWLTAGSFPESEPVLPRVDLIRVGWRTYLGVPAMIARLPREARIERIAPGGTLVSLHGDTFDPADPGQTAEAKSIQDSLTRQGLLHRKAKLEWPPDSQIIGRGLRAS